MKKIFIVVIFLCLSSCNDESVLGNDYYYLTDFEAMDIGYPYGSIVYKSHNKNSFTKIIVYSDVKKCTSDEEYILVLQKPNRELMKSSLKSDMESWNKYYAKNKKDSLINLMHGKMFLNDINLLLKDKTSEERNRIADSIIDTEAFFKKMFREKENYYIIQKKHDSIYGPLNSEEFLKLKEVKNIHLNL